MLWLFSGRKLRALLLIWFSIVLIFPWYCSHSEQVIEADLGKGCEGGRVVVSFRSEERSDATEAIQSAIDSGAREVVIPNIGFPWIVRPINLRSNLALIFMPGVIIEAKRGEFKGRGDSLFSASNVENLKISGYGAVLRMHKRDYQDKKLYEPAEWRMVISLTGCRNVVIEGVRCESSGGDGIYIGSTGERNFCEDVIIRDVVCWNNHRQGISVISAKNLLIENCRLLGTWGTPPQAGIDFEPNSNNEVLTGILMRNCYISLNRGAGILVYLKQLRKESMPIDIRVERCYIKRGDDFGIAIGEDDDGGVRGRIVVKDTVIEKVKKGGIFIFNKSNEGAEVQFYNCTVINSPYEEEGIPVKIYQLKSRGVESLGGICFDNLSIIEHESREPIEIRSVSDRVSVKNIVGSFLLTSKSLAQPKIIGLKKIDNLELKFIREFGGSD